MSVAILLLTLSTFAGTADAQPAPQPRRTDSIATIEDRVAGMKKIDGYFPLYWEDATGRLWMEISRFDAEVLYVTGVGAGLGSNDIGIDRGALSGSRIVKSNESMSVENTPMFRLAR